MGQPDAGLLTGGESHGPGLTAILEGLPAGLEVDRGRIDGWLKRRQHGFGRGGRQRIEKDTIEVTGGLRDGRTLGSPVVLEVENQDWQNWSAVMDPWRVDAEEAAKRLVSRPRPGHADYSGGAATNQHGDMRNVLERAVLLGDRKAVRADDVIDVLAPRGPSRLSAGGGVTLKEAERAHIEAVLREEGGDVRRAAATLGLSRSALYQKIKKHDIELSRAAS